MGINLLKDSFAPSVLNSVEGYILFHNDSGKNRINHGTWDGLLAFVSHRSEVNTVRRRLYTEFYSKPEPKYKYPLKTRYIPFKPSHLNHYCVPFWDSDKACVRRSQMFEYQETDEKPVQFQEYMGLPSLALLPIMGLIGLMFISLAPFKYGRNLLKDHPKIFTFGLFSKKGPTKKDVDGTSFSMTLIGKGWEFKNESDDAEPDYPSNKTITAEIKGPNLAYETSAICLVQAGLTVLEESDKIPFTGGVLPPGFAFRQTSLLERLNRHSIVIKLKE